MKIYLIAILMYVCASTNVFANTQLPKEKVTMSDELYSIPTNCDFTSITSDNLENQCSPKLADPFFSSYEGILINAPKEVIWPKQASLSDYPPNLIGQTSGPLRLMVAGLMRAKYSTLGLKGQFSYHVVVVAVNQKTAKTYSGKMPRGDFEIFPQAEIPKGTPKREDYSDYSESLYSSQFNLDLVYDLGLPIADATYSIYATLGEYKSNELIVKTSVK